MDKHLLFRCGEALYGPRWQTELAKALDMTDRTMRRWVAAIENGGHDPVPPGVYFDLLRMTQERAMMLDALADDLKLASAP